ncbi:MAG: cytochrome c-type biogenesis protein CcmH [Gemmatimonadota bacterium]|nr:cytochrome c-type biogenesis protein CcmH [Gemmatimonadota bacterium]
MNGETTALNRRAFLLKSAVAVVGAGTAGAALSLMPRAASAAVAMNMPMQQQTGDQRPAVAGGVVDMEGEYYKPVRKAAKPNPVVQMSPAQVNDFERKLACPCPCTLDVFTCRTTDFACGNSPAVHRDVQALVAGGYSADEIMNAMLGVYGDEILMAPPKSGINLVGWLAPFAALGTGAVIVSVLLRGWRRNSDRATANAAANAATRPPDVQATDAEMDRLRAALRDDSR